MKKTRQMMKTITKTMWAAVNGQDIELVSPTKSDVLDKLKNLDPKMKEADWTAAGTCVVRASVSVTVAR